MSGLLESVPGFSRLSWALAAEGAPPELLELVHRAALAALSGRDVRVDLFRAVHDWVALQAQARAARAVYPAGAQVRGGTEGRG